METELVSVCIPAYNNEEYIENTINSILNQTYKNIELVVVDDNSTDRTWEIINSIRDDRLKVYHNEQNLGMSGNWNRCLELTTGDFVKLICADDIMDQNALELEANAMRENPSAVLVESDTRLLNLKGEVHGQFKRYKQAGLVNGKKVAKTALIWNNFFGAPVNNLMRRSAMEQVGGFDTNFTYILDFDMWVSIALLGDVFIIHQPLNSFCIRNDSNTGVLIGKKRDVYVKEHIQLLKKHTGPGKVELSGLQFSFSVWFRKFRNSVIGVYLKMFAK